MTAFRSEAANPQFAQYTVTDPVEIAGILSEMHSRRARASVYFPVAPGSMLTSVLGVDSKARTFVFDTDADERRNDALLRSEGIAWITVIEGIRVEFATGRSRRVVFADGPALVADMPDLVLRLQRRGAFRAPVPLSHPPICRVTLSSPHAEPVKARISDISALGLSLLIDLYTLPLAAGMQIERIDLHLPGFGDTQCRAEVRYVVQAGPRFPANFHRAGLKFEGMANADQVMLQRYVHKIERDRARVR